MKILYLIVFFVILSIKLFSQSCEECKEKEFVYKFCENGKEVTHCTSDPYNVPNLILKKKC